MNTNSAGNQIKSGKPDNRFCGCLCDVMDVALAVISYPEGTILEVNHKVCIDLGGSHESLVGSNYREVFWPEFHHVYEELADECSDGRAHTSIYYWAERILWEQITAKRIEWQDGQEAILLNITNITDVARKQNEYERTAYFDNLTELPNGAKLEQDIDDLRSVKDVALIYFQILNYDDIVDLYGWDAGDQLYLSIRDWLIESEAHRAQFYKGERGFIVLGRGVTKTDAIARIELIIERFNHPWTTYVNDKELLLYCTIRIGGVVGEYVRKEIRTLLLRTIKKRKQPRSAYSIYDEKEDEKAKASHRLRNELIDAILNNMEGFSVNYHPIVRAATGEWVGLEALCRWKTPEGRPVSPAEFIPAVEKLGFISEVDGWVRKTAMSELRSLGLNKKHVFLDVNYSPSQPLDKNYVLELLAEIKTLEFPPKNLILEITEAERMVFDEANLLGIKTLKEHGVAVSLDDFGTGYSSLENLLKASASTLKTDKVLVDDIEQKPEKQYLMGILVNLAHHLGMRIIVEGVESQWQRNFVVDRGADYIQGYLFSKPLTAEALAGEVGRFKK